MPSPTATPTTTPETLRPSELREQHNAERERLDVTIQQAAERYTSDRRTSEAERYQQLTDDIMNLENERRAISNLSCDYLSTRQDECEALDRRIQDLREQRQSLVGTDSAMTRRANAYFNSLLRRLLLVHQREMDCLTGGTRRNCTVEHHRTEIWASIARFSYAAFTANPSSFNSDPYLR